MSLFDLTGSVAVVTGSSRGIGRAIAERMIEQGAKVVISSRKPEACENVRSALVAKYGKGKAVAVPANISSKDELHRLVKQTTETLGKIDTLVCNAATSAYYGPIAGISDEQFRKILDNNILSNHWLIGAVLPQMIARKDGSIIIISSVAGFKVSSPGLGIYGVSKAADMQLARALAVEHGPNNVRINCIAPGLIQTDFARAVWENPEALTRAVGQAPLRRIGQPDDVAGAAVFLASKAASFVTGHTLLVDGGLLIG